MKPRHYALLGLGILIGLVAIIGAQFFAEPYTFQGSLIDPPIPAADFTLTDQNGNVLSEDFLMQAPNKLAELLPDTPEEQLEAVRVVDLDDFPGRRRLKLNANTLKQRVVCYLV